MRLSACDVSSIATGSKKAWSGEGYFRLEWKLAVDRSHRMAPDQAFLLPVAIDDTSQADKRIPDRFRELHWTRLLGGETPPDACVCARRDDRNEKGALIDLFANLPIPGIPSPKLALVKPDVDAGCAERLRNALCGCRIFGCVAQEDCTRGRRHRVARHMSGLAGHVRPATSAGVGRPTFRQNAEKR